MTAKLLIAGAILFFGLALFYHPIQKERTFKDYITPYGMIRVWSDGKIEEMA